MKVAEIIVDITASNVDKVFDYLCDENLKVGQRVFVPFGKQIIQGFVICIKDSTNYTKGKLKSVISTVEEDVVILPELIDLMKFMQKKWHLKMVDILRLFIPSEMRTGKVKPIFATFVTLNEKINLQEYKLGLRKNAKKQFELADFLQKGEKYNKTSLCEKFSRQTVQKFVEDGVIFETKEQLQRNPDFIKTKKTEFCHTPLQVRAIDTILSNNGVFLLFGVTGSGKTEVYMSVIEEKIKQGKTAIMLVPEISLTPQVLANFKARFGEEVAILHSGLSAGERYDEWRRIFCDKAKIVVGARSAIFAPLKNLGVIIVDEEHESSYMSESNPRYNAIDVAKFRQNYNNCPLVLASATPSIASFEKAQAGEYNLVELPKRINGKDMPKIQIVDMLSEIKNGNLTIFSKVLREELDKCIKEKKQAMLFINRRGYSSFQRCQNCGYIAKCTDCDVSLVYHKSENRLKCHYCGKRYKVLTKCPECGSLSIREGAVGTEQVVNMLKELYKDVKIFRMDNDTTRTKNAYQKILSEFGSTKPAILVGTQMIAKGHDFADVTVVGIVDADQSLYHSDYKSTEKTFELITQMSGRAGRAESDGKVILQTYVPRHYAYRFIANYDYKSFFEKELNIRKTTKFPPYTKIIRLLFVGENEDVVKETTRQIYSSIRQIRDEYLQDFAYLDALKCPISKIKKKTRYEILMRINTKNCDEIVEKIYKVCDNMENSKVSVFVEIDPQNLS